MVEGGYIAAVCADTNGRAFEVPEGIISEHEQRARAALEALIVALQAAIGEIKALSDARS